MAQNHEVIGTLIYEKSNLPEPIKARVILDIDKSLQAFHQIVDFFSSDSLNNTETRETAQKFIAYRDSGKINIISASVGDSSTIKVFAAEDQGKSFVLMLLNSEFYIGFTSSDPNEVLQSKQESFDATKEAVERVEEFIDLGEEFMTPLELNKLILRLRNSFE